MTSVNMAFVLALANQFMEDTDLLGQPIPILWFVCIVVGIFSVLAGTVAEALTARALAIAPPWRPCVQFLAGMADQTQSVFTMLFASAAVTVASSYAGTTVNYNMVLVLIAMQFVQAAIVRAAAPRTA